MLHSGDFSKITSLFENIFKRRPDVSEEAFNSFVGSLGFSFGDSVVLAYCLYFSQNKLLTSFSKKYLKSKIVEFRSTSFLLELPDSIRAGLISLLQTDEVKIKNIV